MTEIETWTEQCIAGLDVAFPLARRNAQINNLSIEEAIREHVHWFHDWKKLLNSHDNTLCLETVCQDNHCKLGKWIYSLNGSLAETPQYRNLKQSHAQFHVIAADIIKEYRDGDKSAAFAKSRQDLLDTSKQIAVALVDLEAINHA